MSLRCRVESKWHVQLDDLKVTKILELGTAGLVALCPYIGSSGAVSAGVLVVDQRQGDIIENVPLSSPSSGQRDEVASIMVDTIEDDVQFRVTCIMAKGQLWRFSLHLDAHGMLSETKGITCLGNIIQSAVDDEAHFESLLLESLVVQEEQTVSQQQAVDPLPGIDNDLPTFIPENGYRGVKEGYTFWKSEDGKQGYYRDDVMQGILERQRKEQSLDSGETNKRQESLVGDVLTKKIVRCFLKLDSSSKFVMSSCGADDGLLYVGTWAEDSESGENVKITCDSALIGHLSGVLTLAASPDQKLIASGSYDQTIRIWDTRSWKCLKVLKGHGGGIKGLAFTRDGSTLLSTASDNTTRVWSTSTWMCMRHLHGRHEDATWPVSIDLYDPGKTASLPPKFLVSGSNGFFGGSTLKVFDVASGDCLATFAQLRYDHKGSCTAVKIVNNGTDILTAASDFTLAAWTCSFYVEEKKPMIKAGFFG